MRTACRHLNRIPRVRELGWWRCTDCLTDLVDLSVTRTPQYRNFIRKLFREMRAVRETANDTGNHPRNDNAGSMRGWCLVCGSETDGGEFCSKACRKDSVEYHTRARREEEAARARHRNRFLTRQARKEKER